MILQSSSGLVSSKQLSSSQSRAEDTEDSEKCEKIRFIQSHLKIGFCGEYKFAKRNVFGLLETNLGFPAEMHETSSINGGTYTWPRICLHIKARDTHPALEERFPVPDERVFWDFEWCEYTPTLANPDEVNPIDGKKNPCGR
jgi:hypothetical protein